MASEPDPACTPAGNGVEGPNVSDKIESSVRQLARLLDHVRDCAIYMLDPGGHVISWNAGAERIKGYSADEIIGRHFSEFYLVEDRASNSPAVTLETAARTGKFEGEGWRLRKDGTRFWASVLVDAIRSAGGELIGFAKITRDMTEHRAMEEQLRQSQKMEAIGQLTGGVAHDFNNLLTVILGNMDSLAQEVPTEHARWHRRIEHTMRAAERAAGLTQQLLAFARRQPLKPAAVDIDALVTRWTEMIRRMLPERIDIRRITEQSAGLADVDANQLENVLLNLALNARDAMPTGGTLTVETAQVRIGDRDAEYLMDLEPGEYILISVADSGTGMAPDVLERAFEPFFTTKPLGQGTGLGLSQVFGFVKQSGGHVQMFSAVGTGTTARIYLPRIHATMPDQVADETRADAPAVRAETILVVEDNEGVRSYASEALRDRGFSVVEASNAAEALEVLNEIRIDLLFSDIGLPGMNGRELLAVARRRLPELAVLLTSGYAQMSGAGDPADVRNVGLVTKPFTRAQLLQHVLAVLDRQHQRGH